MAELITGYGIEQDEVSVQAAKQLSQYLTFQVADEMYAVEILDIKEILEIGRMTPVPMMPEFIRGVINLRGRVVPVIDLAARMHKGQSPVSKRSGIVLISVTPKQGPPQAVGMLVSAINEIVEMEPDHIQPAPDMGQGVDTGFIKAMARLEEGFFILLDVDHILSHEEVCQIEQLHNHRQTVTDMPAGE